MACGLPVISTNVGYIGDLLEHDVNSFVIDLPYKVNLINCINSLLLSSELREKLGTSARLTIENSYEWSLVFNQYRHEIIN